MVPRSRSRSLFTYAAIVAVFMAGCHGSGGSLTPPVSGPAPFGQSLIDQALQPGLAPLRSQPPVAMQLSFLMTDGSVLAQSNQDNAAWYKYLPDKNGNYSDGTWTQVARLPQGYGPSAFSSAVLADGRLLISGGEYNSPGNYNLQLTNLGAVYDPIQNTWTKLGHPTGWQWIGDSPNSVLPGGKFFMAQKLTKAGAELDPKTLQWKIVGTAGKSDFNAEEGFTLLPNGTVLTADVKNAPNSEIWNPGTGQWKSAGSTIVDLHSPTDIQGCLTYGPKPQDCYYPPGEIGPSILRPDGTVFYFGSYTASGGAGHTAIYNIATGTWKAGPDFPNDDNAGDSFAVLLPSSDVLVLGSSGTMYLYDGKQFTNVGSVSGAPLLLPTGQVLMVGSTDVLYTPAGKPQASWAPTISSVPATVTRGQTYTVTGTKFNGWGQAMSFGDEYQNATNYPLVRIKNVATGHVFYARTHDHSTMAVATGSKPVSTHFDVPANAETGASTLVVVANGIASAPKSITVQ